jgi:hypothetical protein
MEVAYFCGMLVFIRHTTWHFIPGHSGLSSHCTEDLRSEAVSVVVFIAKSGQFFFVCVVYFAMLSVSRVRNIE